MSGHGYQARNAMRPESLGFPVVAVSKYAAPGGVARTRLSRLASLHLAAFLALLALDRAGAPLGGSVATLAACAMILLFGLPHGALDLELIKRERGTGRLGMSAVLVLYLALAAAMASVWHLVPVAALAMFMVVAVIHFAEDWPELRSNFLAQGMAIAMLSAPTLLHLAELKILFEALSGRGETALVADLMLLLAPMSLGVAMVSIWTLWRRNSQEQAVVGAVALVGMISLPPVIGFVLFFCLAHSPRHLRMAMGRMAWAPSAPRIIALVTCAALGITAALFAGQERAQLSAQMVAASFMTLSLLTVPHMLVPVVIDVLAARRRGTAATMEQANRR